MINLKAAVHSYSSYFYLPVELHRYNMITKIWAIKKYIWSKLPYMQIPYLQISFHT